MKALICIINVIILSLLAAQSVAQTDYFNDVVLIKVFEDTEATYSVDDVLTQQAQFTILQQPPSFGSTPSHIWLHLEASNVKAGLAKEIWLDIDNPSLDHLIVYARKPAGDWQQIHHMGDTQPHSSRVIDSRSYVIPLDLNLHADYLIEVYGQTPLLLPMYVGTDHQILSLVAGKESVIIFLFGIIFAMTLFNLVVFVASRYPEYGWYCIYMTSMGMSLVFSSGIGATYLWRDNVWLQNYIGFVLYIFVLWGAFNFIHAYLNVKVNYPRISKLFFGFAQLPFLLLIPLFIDKHLTLSFITLFMMVLFISGPIMGLISWLKRIEGSFIFLVSWTIMVAGLMTFNFTVQGNLPGKFLFVHAAEIGVAIEAILLSFALIYRMRKIEVTSSLAIQESHNEVTAALALVEKSNAAKDVFMTTVGHQLKTPIHLLMGNLQMLSEDLAEHNEYGKAIVQSDRSATELLFRIDNLLTYSQIVADDIRPLMQKINIRTEFKLLESKWRHLYEKPRVNFDVDFDPKIPMKLELDWVHLRKIFRLVLEHMLEMPKEGRVHIGIKYLAETLPKIVINVECSGYEFEQDECEWFNAPFSEQQWESDSLGLFMSKNLVHYIGADAEMSNTEMGAQLKLTCPVNEIAVQLAVEVQPIEQMKVLVVDDIDLNLKLMQTMLNKIGVEATLVDSGEKAIEALAENHFDLILMDCQMPGLSGQETTQLIRQQGADGMSVPIVAVSANDSDLDRESCFYAGMNDFLAKPVRLRALEQKLKDWQDRT